jgi:putative solute:sodium symporter small subunit
MRRATHPTSPITVPEPPPEPPRVSEHARRAHQRYWRFNLALIAVLMSIGFVVSFGLPLAAPDLAARHFRGFSLPFYVGAQGAILLYVVLVLVYIGAMQLADRRLRTALADEAATDARQDDARQDDDAREKDGAGGHGALGDRVR